MKIKKSRELALVVFLLLCLLLNSALNWVLMPPNVVRTNLQQLKREQDYEYLFIGTSHGQYGISPQSIEETSGVMSFNLCMADAYPVDMYYLLKEACRTQKPKKVIYEVDPSYWMLEQRQGSTAIGFYKEFPMSFNKLTYFFDKIMALDFRGTLFPWSYYRNLLPQAYDTMKIKMGKAYKQYDSSLLNDGINEYQQDGFVYREHNGEEDKGTFNNVPWDENNVKESALKYLEKTVAFCKSRNIELQLVVLPVPEETIQNASESFQKADEYFAKLAKQYELGYNNFNSLTSDELDRSINGYWDYDGHMYGEQAKQFSKLLGTYLKK